MHDIADLMQDFLYKEIFILYQKNQIYEDELYILADDYFLHHILEEIDVDKNDIPILTHGLIVPLGYIDKRIIDVGDLSILIVSQDNTPKTDEINSILNSDGICVVGRIANIYEHGKDNKSNKDKLFDNITNTIETIIHEEAVDKDEVYILVGYNIGLTITIADDQVDHVKIDNISSVIDDSLTKEKKIKPVQ
jgi:hypothetical protein